MFTVTVGALTIEVSCPLVEQAVEAVHRTEGKVDHLLAGPSPPVDGPRIEFTIGPITEQREE